MLKAFVIMTAAGLATAAPAQTGPGADGLAGVLGGVLPQVGAVGAGNAAGLLGYCLKNNLLGGAGATSAAGDPGGALGGLLRGAGVVPNAIPSPSPTPVPAASAGGARAVLDRLLSRPGVQRSPGYKAGEAGQVQTAAGRTLGLNGLQGQLRSQMCKLVLNRAKSFL